MRETSYSWKTIFTNVLTKRYMMLDFMTSIPKRISRKQMDTLIMIEIFCLHMLVLRQVVDKYLVQDRSGGGVYETPQFMYMMIALTIFAEYPKEKRLKLCPTLLRRNQQTQNQHPHAHYGRCQNTHTSICILCSG